MKIIFYESMCSNIKGGMKMLFDSHAHVASTTTDIRFRPDYTIESIIHDMDLHNIDKSLVMINPLFKFLKCSENAKHRVVVQDTSIDGVLRLFCLQCNKVIYEGPDPMRKYNLEFIEACAKYPNRFFPMLTLLLSNSTIPTEISFFEKNFSSSFVGYKLHPRVCFRSIDEIKCFPSKRPIIIHIGVDFPPTTTNINFVKNYAGSVLLAHAGRFDPELLYLAKNYPNVYIDAAPSSLMFNGRQTDLIAPYNTLIQTPEDIYKYLIKEIGEDKVLFGSDVPWGNYDNEIAILNAANLPKNIYDKISHLNLINALK